MLVSNASECEVTTVCSACYGDVKNTCIDYCLSEIRLKSVEVLYADSAVQAISTNAQFTPPARQDKTVLSVSCLVWRCELDKIAINAFRVQFFCRSATVLSCLSGILFTPPKRTRHRQDSFVCVVSGVAVWISFNEHQVARRTWKGAGVDWKQAEFDSDGNIVSLPKICPASLPANS